MFYLENAVKIIHIRDMHYYKAKPRWEKKRGNVIEFMKLSDKWTDETENRFLSKSPTTLI